MESNHWPHLGETLHECRKRIDAIANGRPVQIVAVTKGFGPEAIIAAQRVGLNEVGENYAQEAKAKYETLSASGAVQPAWHFIGQLQSNKVRHLSEFVSVWQTVDSASLVHEIAKRAPGAKVMIQVNLSADSGRGGCSWDDLPVLVEKARAAELDVVGLMTVGVHGDPEDSRSGFNRLAGQAVALEIPEVSMGMSGDYEVAVQEGSTIVRLGSVLFGDRPPRSK